MGEAAGKVVGPASPPAAPVEQARVMQVKSLETAGKVVQAKCLESASDLLKSVASPLSSQPTHTHLHQEDHGEPPSPLPCK